MKLDAVTRYVQLHSALIKEKAALEERLTQINQALKNSGRPMATFAAPPARATTLTRSTGRGGARPRVANELSLKEAMIKASGGKALTKPEILAGVQRLGYKFAGKNPMNSVNVQLYTKGQFKKHPGGRFSPIR